MRAQWADTTGRHIVFGWGNIKVARADHHPEWVGLRVPELRALLGAGDDLDAFLDASLAEDLDAVFTLAGSGGSAARAANPTTAAIVAHPLTLPGSSDAGAHLSSYCGVDYTTRLLTEYVPGRAPARVGGRAARARSRRRSTGSATAASSDPVRSPTS